MNDNIEKLNPWRSAPSSAEQNMRHAGIHAGHAARPAKAWRMAGAAGLLAATLAVGCSDPDTPNGGGAGFASAPQQCAPGNAFEPLRAPRGLVRTGLSGVCVGCTVMDAEAAVDDDPTNFATLNVPVAVTGTAFLSVFDSARTHPPDSRVAVFVAGEEDAIPLTIGLNQEITVTTLLDGQEQESTDPSASPNGQVFAVLSLLDLPSVLTTPANPGPRTVGAQFSKEFDEVRLDFGGGLQVLNGLRLFEICVSDG
ncbi:MAG: hypothetical protein ACPGZP_03180 [Panacagrimonas sp.]